VLYICTTFNMYSHTLTHIYTYMYICIYVCIYICSSHTHIYIYDCIYICSSSSTSAADCNTSEYYDIWCVFTHTHIHVYIYLYIYIYIYIYIFKTVPVQQTATHLCGIWAVEDARDSARNVVCIWYTYVNIWYAYMHACKCIVQTVPGQYTAILWKFRVVYDARDLARNLYMHIIYRNIYIYTYIYIYIYINIYVYIYICI